MTPKRQWSILIAIFLMLGLFLAACVRPLPGDNEASSTTAPAEGDTSAESEPYPPPAESEGPETSTEGYPAEESYPAGEEGETDEGELLQPTEEEESAEAYPAAEGEAPPPYDAPAFEVHNVNMAPAPAAPPSGPAWSVPEKPARQGGQTATTGRKGGGMPSPRPSAPTPDQ